ncbi:MAG TPA: threonylcarbamoyl-AMP synthase [Candidatus Alectryocaccomicrobium excrementavium]|uniref:Threonylcarbamoyl-AMP synthase n=1 Tax=Candidatus Alectryocaccomicrobium excrementavium TaxID=2840668 RepID=A0A9D1FZT8_9FIRM|nr:threonylcarbamoyl-AMP synthase [Candidatus Alectryocaccomicrobium excrementavium]
MHTELCHADDASIRRAAALLRAGELVAFPTETVYGLGADALNGGAAARIFAAKGRPADNPLIAHIAGESDLSGLIAGEPVPCARALMRAFWPGPMTLIFPKSARVPREVTAGLDTVAVRMPSHPVARALISAAQTPIAAPSANRSGRPSPTTAAHVLEDMDGRIPLILDGGPCEVGLESTVVDVTGARPRILRPGGVTREMLEGVVGAVDVDEGVLHQLQAGSQARSPGMKYKHYAPRGEMTIVTGPRAAQEIARLYDAAGGRAAILAFSQADYGARRVYRLKNAPGELFAVLRQLDEDGVETIYAEDVPTNGVGLAVMNRLMRAAAFRVHNAE